LVPVARRIEEDGLSERGVDVGFRLFLRDGSGIPYYFSSLYFSTT